MQVIRMGDITKFDDAEVIDVVDMKSKKCCDTCKYYEWYYDKCNKYNCKVDDRSVCSSHKEREQDDSENE